MSRRRERRRCRGAARGVGSTLVAGPNPRAQAFYREHGFVPDGTAQIDDGSLSIR